MRNIIQILLLEIHPITTNELALRLGVSDRTILRDLNQVEKVLQKHHLTLNRKPGTGIQISGKDTNKQALKVILKELKYTDFTPEERQTIILLALLESNSPVKLFTLSNELQVTDATVSNDLDVIEQQLDEYDLTLLRRRGYGVTIQGNEANKRSMISHLISNHLDEIELMSMMKSNIQLKSSQTNMGISNRLLGIIKPEKLQIIEREVEIVRTSLPYGLADSAYIGLVVHLALVVERLEQGGVIEFDSSHLRQIQRLEEYTMATELIHRLENSLKITIPIDEIGYITMHLLGAKLRIDHNYLIEDDQLKIAYRAKKLIHFVSEMYEEDLMENYGLLNDLVAHLKPAIYRIKQQMKIKNPMIDEIKGNYEELFEVIQGGVRKAFPTLDFPDEEIGYLVLHFGSALIHSKDDIALTAIVICPSGIGTARMLAEKLRQKLPEIKQVTNKSLFDLNDYVMSPNDLIVSTVPLKGIEDYILATPFLTKDDIHHIRKVIRRKQLAQPIPRKKKLKKPQKNQKVNLTSRLQNMQNFSKSILYLVENFRVYKLEAKQNIADHVLNICKILAKNIEIDQKQVLHDLQARESIGGLGIPGTALALYHTRTTGVQQISFTNFSIEEPITIKAMDEDEIQCKQIIVMLAPQDPNQEMLEILSFISGMIIKDQKTIEIFERANEKEIYSLLTDQLEQLITEKLS